MTTEYVTVDACARTRESINREFGNIGVELCSHDEDLTDIKIAISRLTIIQEQLYEKSNILPFIQTDLGKRIVWGLFVLSSIVLLVALGQNIDWIDKLLIN